MVAKKRRIAKKPIEATTTTAAADWVQAGGADPEISAPVSAEPQSRSPVKSKSPDFTRCTVYLTKELHKRLKIAGAIEGMEMSDIAETAITQWLDAR